MLSSLYVAWPTAKERNNPNILKANRLMRTLKSYKLEIHLPIKWQILCLCPLKDRRREEHNRGVNKCFASSQKRFSPSSVLKCFILPSVCARSNIFLDLLPHCLYWLVKCVLLALLLANCTVAKGKRERASASDSLCWQQLCHICCGSI